MPPKRDSTQVAPARSRTQVGSYLLFGQISLFCLIGLQSPDKSTDDSLGWAQGKCLMPKYPRSLTITWLILKDYQMIKKWDNHPGENSHLKADQTTSTVPNHCLTCAFMSSKLNSCGLIQKQFFINWQ